VRFCNDRPSTQSLGFANRTVIFATLSVRPAALASAERPHLFTCRISSREHFRLCIIHRQHQSCRPPADLARRFGASFSRITRSPGRQSRNHFSLVRYSLSIISLDGRCTKATVIGLKILDQCRQRGVSSVWPLCCKLLRCTLTAHVSSRPSLAGGPFQHASRHSFLYHLRTT
jgi:hypothetical protein